MALKLGDRTECRFWDFNHSQWSSSGCQYLHHPSNRWRTHCRCRHLTNFAAIMDFSGRETQSLAKTIVTWFFSFLSVLSLILLIILLSNPKLEKLFGKLFKSTRDKKRTEMTKHVLSARDAIAIHQSASLLVADLVVLLLMDRRDVKVILH